MNQSLFLRSRAVGALLLASAGLLLALPPGHAASEPAPWMIESETTIPPGAYREVRPFHIEGDFAITVQPGVLLDDVKFEGTKNGQHWRIDGDFFRKVRVAGQLSVTLDAKDSAFEDCEFAKVGGWFTAYWGTHWTFDSCVFTKRFFHDFGLGDYAIQATHCTFIGVKLPTIDLKGDPASYLQQENLKFEDCRFVQCEVPQSFLAATVNCIFEGCQFPPKKKDWPKEMKPVAVQAYFAGLTNPPKSFVDGPFAVQFTEAGRRVAGCTLPFTQQGGRISLNRFSGMQQFASLETAINPLGKTGDTANSGSPSAFGTPSPLAPADSLPTIKGLDEIVRQIPGGVDFMSGGQISVVAVQFANKSLGDSLSNHALLYRGNLAEIQPFKDTDFPFRLVMRDQPFTYRGLTIPTRVIALFRTAQIAPLVNAPKGSEVTLKGLIDKAEFQGAGRNLSLTITLKEAQKTQ